MDRARAASSAEGIVTGSTFMGTAVYMCKELAKSRTPKTSMQPHALAPTRSTVQ